MADQSEDQGDQDSKTVYHRPMVIKKTMNALGIKKKRGSESYVIQGSEKSDEILQKYRASEHEKEVMLALNEEEINSLHQPTEKLLQADHEDKTASIENEKVSLKEDHKRQLGTLTVEVEELRRCCKEQHEEMAKLMEQLQLKTDKLSTFEKEYTDPMALRAQKEEYDKAQQDIAVERRHYKNIEAQNVDLKAKIERLKQQQLTAEVSGQGESFTQVDLARSRQQLQEELHRIKQLSSAVAPTAQVESRDVAVQSEPTAGEQDTHKTIDRLILQIKGMTDELEKCHKELKRAKHLEMTLSTAIQTFKEEINVLKKDIATEEQKYDEILQKYRASEHEKEIILASNEEWRNSLHQKITEKELVNRELTERLCTMKIELQAAQDDLEMKQSELSHLMQENEALRSITKIAKINSDKIREIADENDALKEKITELTGDLSVAKTQVSIYEEELQKTMEEEKKLKSVSTQVERELRKAGKRTVEEMRKENDEMREKLQAVKEEEASTHQQLKSYKKTLDDINEKLRAANEGKKQLQERLQSLENYQGDKKFKDLKNSNIVLQRKLQAARTVAEDQECQIESNKRENIHLQTQIDAQNKEIKALQEVVENTGKQSWLVETDEIRFTDETIAGKGSYGSVRVAVFRGTRVAAKCIHDAIISDYNKGIFIREMGLCATVQHPNVVQFIGAADVANPILLYELMTTSLNSHLQKGQPLARPRIIDAGRDIAAGLAYLHLRKPHPIIHRDVSSPNVLMDPLPGGRWRCKLSDLGAANVQCYVKTEFPGNAAYSAPEAKNWSAQSPAMDVYSYGVLIMEMTLNKPPEMVIKKREFEASTIRWGPVKTLVQQCITEDCSKRPVISHVLEMLKNII